ncbi:hypothetical protein JP75_00380 [Devosia riboflavina]|uniref:Uncharacterized protein n=1 Tax=Devosia riboflavina TaxID=46914 RepID=A0A087M700_9HYPH|nr:hypothetical protein JP75_00380 [Devosia riboflavina]
MTKENTRRQEARNAAALYAPAPNGSMLTHAIVGFSIAVMLMFAIAGFYGVDFFRLPMLAASLALVAGLAGIATNRVRTRRNRRAIENEYQSRARRQSSLHEEPRRPLRKT